jgi:exonuclease SbcC
MIPVKLTLQGFLSYREETVVDFSRLEVACISGANGAGKSSLLDAITWALFGKARRNDDDALINDALKRNQNGGCRVALEFDYESSRYRVERTKESRKPTQLEFQIRADDGEWKSLTETGLRATEDHIRQTLHLDYDTFINSSFFLQGKADLFAQQIPAKRKEILGNILGLEVWEAYRNEAARRRHVQESELNVRQQLLKDIQNELDQEVERRKNLALLSQALEKSAALRAEQENNYNRIKADYQQVRADQEKASSLEAQLETDRKRQQEIDVQLAQRRSDWNEGAVTLAQADEITQAYQSWRTMRDEVEKWDELADRYHSLQVKRGQVEAGIGAEEARLRQEQHGLQEKQQDIVRKQELQAALQIEVEANRQRLAELEAHLKEMPQLEERLAALQDHYTDLKAENLRLKVSMLDVKKNIDTLQSATGSQCPLCGQALTDEHRRTLMDNFYREGKSQGDRSRENSHLMEENDKEQTALKNRQEQFGRDQAEWTALQRSFGQRAAPDRFSRGVGKLAEPRGTPPERDR